MVVGSLAKKMNTEKVDGFLIQPINDGQAEKLKKFQLGGYPESWDWRVSYTYKRAGFGPSAAMQHFQNNGKKLVMSPLCPQCGQPLSAGSACGNPSCPLCYQHVFYTSSTFGSVPNVFMLNQNLPTLNYEDWRTMVQAVQAADYDWKHNPLTAYYQLYWDVQTLILLAKQIGVRHLKSTDFLAVWKTLTDQCRDWISTIKPQLILLLAHQNGFFIPSLAEHVLDGMEYILRFLNPAVSLETRQAMRFVFRPIWNHLGENSEKLGTKTYPNSISLYQWWFCRIEDNFTIYLMEHHGLNCKDIWARFHLKRPVGINEKAIELKFLLNFPINARFYMEQHDGSQPVVKATDIGELTPAEELNLLKTWAETALNNGKLTLSDLLTEADAIYELYSLVAEMNTPYELAAEPLMRFVYPAKVCVLGLMDKETVDDINHIGVCSHFIDQAWDKAKLFAAQKSDQESEESDPLVNPWSNLYGLKLACIEAESHLLLRLTTKHGLSNTEAKTFLQTKHDLTIEDVAAFLPAVREELHGNINHAAILQSSAETLHAFFTANHDFDWLVEQSAKRMALDLYTKYADADEAVIVISNLSDHFMVYHQPNGNVDVFCEVISMSQSAGAEFQTASNNKLPVMSMKDAVMPQIIHGGMKLHCSSCGAPRSAMLCTQCGNSSLIHNQKQTAQQIGAYTATPIPMIKVCVNDDGYFSKHIARLSSYIRHNRFGELPCYESLDGIVFTYGGVAKLTGVHEKWILHDQNQQSWLFKPDKHLHGMRAEIESFSAWVFRKVNIYTPPTFVTTHKKMVGSVQPIIPDVKGMTADPLEWSLTQVQELLAAQVVRWSLSDHDGNHQNYLEVGPHAIPIDMGQAYRYFGSDELSEKYHPNSNYGTPEPVSNLIWRYIKKGKLPFEPDWIVPTIQAIEAIPDEEFGTWLEKIAKQSIGVDGIAWQAVLRQQVASLNGIPAEQVSAEQLVAQFVSAGLERKNKIRSDYQSFLDKLLGHKKITL